MIDASYVRLLYRRILCEGIQFFDDRARTYIVNRTRNAFRSYKQCTEETRIKNKCREARKQLHRLERANRGDLKSGLKILELAYGRRGKARHRLLRPYAYTHLPADLPVPEPLVPHVPHTAPPPPLCPPLAALIRLSLGKKLEPELPKPEFKPLHPGRQANLLWRWRNDLLTRVQLPLPLEIIRELEQKAGAPHDDTTGDDNGGPLWNELYADQSTHVDIIHLCPTTKLVPRSKVKRSHRPIPDSSSVYDTASIIRFVDPSFDLTPDPYVKRMSKRKTMRLYKRLLKQVPFLTPIPSAASLWDSTIKYSVGHSKWIPGNVVNVLK